MLNGMARDFSWAVSAREYLKIYEKVRASRRAPLPWDEPSHQSFFAVAN